MLLSRPVSLNFQSFLLSLPDPSPSPCARCHCSYCSEFYTGTEDCVYYTTVTQPISYQPPFLYNYQCSSAILTNYAAVYVYAAIISTFAIPLIKFWTPCGQTLFGHKFMGFTGLTFTTRIITLVSILVTFGVVFPLLAPPIALCLVMETYTAALDIGRNVLHEGDNDENHTTAAAAAAAATVPTDGDDEESEGARSTATTTSVSTVALASANAVTATITSAAVHTDATSTTPRRVDFTTGRFPVDATTQATPPHSIMPVGKKRLLGEACAGVSVALFDSLWSLVPLATTFYAFFVFDVVGGSVGFAQGWWAPLTVVLLPLAVSAGLLIVRVSLRKRNIVSSTPNASRPQASTEATPDFGVEMEVRPSSMSS